jgi:hypothetical protein
LDIHAHKDTIYQYVRIFYSLLCTSLPDIKDTTFTVRDYDIIDTYIQEMKYTTFTLESKIFNKCIVSTSTPYAQLIYTKFIQLNAKDKRYKKKKRTICIQSFDKDDIYSNHTECITYMANFRAINYNIEHTTVSKCRIIAGNIIPALSTTTTLVTALSIMEMLKYISNTHIVHADHFINMGVNTFIQSEPMDTVVMSSGFNSLYGCNVIVKPEPFSIWDKIMIRHKELSIYTVHDIILYIEHMLHIPISLLSVGDHIIYTAGDDNHSYISIDDIYKQYNYSKQNYIQFNITAFECNSLVICPNILLSMYQ